jgi:hypothetical protein
MKSKLHTLRQSLKNTKTFTLFLPALLIAFTLASVIVSSDTHDAELRFAEKSDNTRILGGMLPASCESGGFVGPEHTSACSWTEYCTGPSDPNGNNWQIWEQSNDDTVDYNNLNRGCEPNVNISFPY